MITQTQYAQLCAERRTLQRAHSAALDATSKRELSIAIHKMNSTLRTLDAEHARKFAITYTKARAKK